MTSIAPAARLDLDDAVFGENYDRAPFGFSHNLHRLALFENETLRCLCERYAAHPEDYFVSRSAPTAAAVFYSVPKTPLKPHEAFDQLTAGSYKILLKRLERHHDGFRDLMNSLFAQVKRQLQRHRFPDEAVRLESSIFISAPQATTPFHFDPEVNFFSQIEGEKIYHIYEPSVLGEDEVEGLYVRATTDIGQVDLARRDPSAEHVFQLRPGTGLHQPQDAPHWVETVGSRSISYTFVYETPEGRMRSRVRSFNAYLRRLHFDPARPGERPARDAMKAAAMAAAIPVRRQIGKAVRSVLRA
jgi:Cupin superfamily protein